jgi:uncharacterized protein (TIGR03032 family)
MTTKPQNLASIPSFELVELVDYEIESSPHLADWLAEQQISLGFTSPLENSLFLVGLGPDGQLSVTQHTFEHAMGLVAPNSQSLYMTTAYQIWRLENALPPGRLTEDGCDRFYIPQMGYTTGHIDIHDLAVGENGQIYFACTAFNCLATTSPTKNFVPLWQPSFLNSFGSGDFCHLNGLAMRQGRPAYMTCFAQTATDKGWRERQSDGGAVLDVETSQAVATGLCMPNSPRWYQDRLWLANSGAGQFGYVDLQRGHFEPVVEAPGYLRGLAFHGDYGVVGSSQPRHNDLYSGLPLHDRLQKEHAQPHRGLYVVHLPSGQIEHWLNLEVSKGEIYDVVILPNVRRPKAVGLYTLDIQKWVTVAPKASLF